MIIKDLFAKDINRTINGVVKVAQDDEASIEQELSEYVITRELQRHFTTFFESYTEAIDAPTDRIGVWISGFFGSGKSHFLKMLSYLLANREVGGRTPYQYFEDKVADPMVRAQMKRACDIPTETILFNIDDKASNWKEGPTAKTALLRAFARVFYEHRGFCGTNLSVGRLEEHIAEQGKTDEFRAAFARINGETWENTRDQIDFFEDDLVEALQEVFDWSEQQARNQAGALYDDAAVAPEDLVDQIAAYADARAAEVGGQFRLLFMVDEVGQFIGSDVNLMLNLQTIVEDLGAQCRGRVWVMVTSQEAIDEVTKVSGNDFSKIQGRFNTRLSLSSSSVDEVIKRRVLDKTDTAAALLDATYDAQSAVLKNLFTFEDSRTDLVGYRGPEDFREAYPFVEYQFNLMRDVLKQIRIHGNSGKHLSGGERSMLSGFQESAQAVAGRETGALVPLWRFYDTLAEFLEHDIRQVIDRCQRAAEDGAGIQLQDVEVLKTLYLIRYIDDVKPTIGNIAVLMVDEMTADKVQMRAWLGESLARLVRENYVSRSGDTYQFLTNEEQDITREIKSMDVDAAGIIEEVKKTIFAGICTSAKVRVGVNDFKFDAYVDDSPYGQPSGGMPLHVVTLANPMAKQDAHEVGFASSGKAIVVLGTAEDYYEVLENAAKIDKWMRTRSREALPEGTQRIYDMKRKESNAAKKIAGLMIERDLKDAIVAVDGSLAEVRAASGKDKLDQALQLLAKSVYRHANKVSAPLAQDTDITAILRRNDGRQDSLDGMGGANAEADAEVQRFLDARAYGYAETSVGEVIRHFQNPPYGWRELDISGCLARLAADQKVEFVRAGASVALTDTKLTLYLTRRSEWDKTAVRIRKKVDDIQLRRVRDVLGDLELGGSVPAATDEDGLAAYVTENFTVLRDWCKAKLTGEYTKVEYPGRAVVVDAISLLDEVLDSAKDRIALFNTIASHENDLLDMGEDLESVRGFFPNQQRIFDEALSVLKLMERPQEREAVQADAPAAEALSQMREIVQKEGPWRDIQRLGGLTAQVREAHEKQLKARRLELLDKLNATRAALASYAEGKSAAEQVVSSLETTLASRRGEVNGATTMEALDAQELRIGQLEDNRMRAIDDAVDAANAAQAAAVIGRTQRETAPSPAKPTKELDRRTVCPSKRLSTPEEVEAYVQNIRQQLLQALTETGSVRLK